MRRPCAGPIDQPDRVLDLVSGILSGQDYTPIGSPSTPTPGEFRSVRRLSSNRPDPSADLVLALGTLGSFDLSGHVLTELVRVSILPYLTHAEPAVRVQAAQTSCLVLARDPIMTAKSAYSLELVQEVIVAMLRLSLIDQGASSRTARADVYRPRGERSRPRRDHLALR